MRGLLGLKTLFFPKDHVPKMDLETHSRFLFHIGNLLATWPKSRHEFHLRTAANLSTHQRITAALLEDQSGKKARDLLLEAAAHMKIAGDKIVKEQENRL